MSSATTYSVPTEISSRDFWAAVDVWIKKPHVLNRRLWGTSLLYTFKTSQNAPWDPYKYYQCLDSLRENDINDEQKVLNFVFDNMNLQPPTEDDEGIIEISIVKMLPKLGMEPCIYQFVAAHYLDNVAFFADVSSTQKHNLGPSFPYSFHFSSDMIVLKALNGNSNIKSLRWLKETVLPQILKWGKGTEAYGKNHDICSGSLNLIHNEVYYAKYNELKLKYGKEMVKNWSESTDPRKFVYEDVAIASYLLVLWQSERERLKADRMQSFVDLGCGNGLLVHILAGEGHNGRGIDVRKRQIWDLYPHNVVLKEQTISPSDMHLFPNADWIIGNHSDELTPWIPVIAARSSYKCNFFLLPCCCYNFNGSKYQRRDSSKSQYTEYLEYIRRLCENCGFKTLVDRLKIPSTKRICLIGIDRTYAEDKFEDMCSTIQDFIAEGNKGDEWISDFKPREATERVRNCTQIDKSIIDFIVDIISRYLIKDCKKDEAWSKGSEVEFNEIVNLVPGAMLKALKSECGGLQTLLKNNHHIFKVESGKVQLRYPQTVSQVTEIQKKRKSKSRCFSVKKKACWFHSKHPQGCPLPDEDCSFSHGTQNEMQL